MGLIYQSNVETSADPSAQINLRQRSRVIYETFVCRQSHRMIDKCGGQNENRPKRGSNLMKEKLILLQKHPLSL